MVVNVRMRMTVVTAAVMILAAVMVLAAIVTAPAVVVAVVIMVADAVPWMRATRPARRIDRPTDIHRLRNVKRRPRVKLEWAPVVIRRRRIHRASA
jgi:hypothetical protein